MCANMSGWKYSSESIICIPLYRLQLMTTVENCVFAGTKENVGHAQKVGVDKCVVDAMSALLIDVLPPIEQKGQENVSVLWLYITTHEKNGLSCIIFFAFFLQTLWRAEVFLFSRQKYFYVDNLLMMVPGGCMLVLITDKGRGRIATCQQARGDWSEGIDGRQGHYWHVHSSVLQRIRIRNFVREQNRSRHPVPKKRLHL